MARRSGPKRVRDLRFAGYHPQKRSIKFTVKESPLPLLVVAPKAWLFDWRGLCRRRWRQTEEDGMKRVVAIAASLALVAFVASMTLASASQERSAKRPSWHRLVTSAPSAAKGSHQHCDERLVVTELNATETEIDNPPEGFSQGDEVAFAGDLFRGSELVGYDDGHAVFTLVTQTEVRIEVQATATVQGDEITVAGSLTFTEEAAPDPELSVVGGTGRYDDVGGEFTVVEQENHLRFVFCLNHLD
jgi:hypothetical protein